MTPNKKPKVKAWEGWAVINVERGEEDILVGDVTYQIFQEDCKIFAKKFCEARSTMSGRKNSKIIPVLITPLNPKGGKR